MKRLGLCLAFCVGFAAPALAQEQGKGEVYSEDQYRETQALIDRMQAKINGINNAASERDKEIEFLNKQINDAIQVSFQNKEGSPTMPFYLTPKQDDFNKIPEIPMYE